MASSYQQSQHLRTAIRALQVVMALLMGTMLVRALQLQIIDHDEYLPISDQNSIRQEFVPPARGNILDRNGVYMVENVPVYALYVTPSVFDTSRIPLLAELLGVPVEDVRTRYAKARAYSRHRPSRLYDEVEFDAFSLVEEQIWQLPGLSHQIESKRAYPTGVIGAHLFGYLGEVSEAEYEADAGYRLGDKTGRSGIEASYETDLRGVTGIEHRVVNAYGQALGPYNNGDLDVEPVKGHTLFTGIDADLQALAETLMVGKTGSLVAMDPNTGEILAMVSAPFFQTDRLSGRLDRDYWVALNNDPQRPLFNRAVTTRQPPGSTFKPVMGLLGLRLGVITPETRVQCTGGYFLGRLYRCTERHGSQNLEQAIMNSCNTYFYALMNRLVNQHGLNVWHEMVGEFGLGRRNGLDMPSESPGILPDSSYFDRAFGVRKWGIGDLINLGIGQGAMGFSPLQMAEVASVIANGGTWVRPHVVTAVETPDGRRRTVAPERDPVSWIRPQDLAVVRTGMRRAVLEGSGRFYANIPDVEVAGKTGTAQNPHGRDHGWYIGFAPYDNPRIAVAVIIENGGFGSVSAAPIASLLIEQYINGEIKRPHVVQAMLNFIPRDSNVRR